MNLRFTALVVLALASASKPAHAEGKIYRADASPEAIDADPFAACLAALPVDLACTRLDPIVDDGLLCECVPAKVARVEAFADPAAVDPGERTRLGAVAYDADGERLIARPSFPVIDAGLPIEGDVATAVTIGDHWIVAQAGGVTSLPSHVLVIDPRDAEWRLLTGRVSFPVGLEPQAAFVLGPDGTRRPLGGDGRFELEVKRWRNQRVMVLGADGETPLLFGIARGSIEGQPDEELTIDLRSTADALVFLAPGNADPDPEAFVGFRALTDVLPATAELEGRLRGNWQVGGGPLSDPMTLAPSIQAVSADLRTVAELTLERAGQAPDAEPQVVLDDDIEGTIIVPRSRIGSAVVDPDAPFEPRLDPTFASGLKATITKQRERVVTVHFANRFVRRVDLYLEEVQRDGGRPGRPNTVRYMGAHTSLPSVGKILAGLVRQGNPLAEFNSPATTALNLALPPGASWRVFAYGPGAKGVNVPAALADSPTTLTRRLAFPVARTIVYDFVANGIAIISTVDKEAFQPGLDSVVRRLTVALSAGSLADAAARFFSQGDADIEFLGLMFDQADDAIRSVLLGLTSEGVQKVSGLVLDVYAASVNLLDIVLATYAYRNSHTVEVFTVFDGAVTITPATLPDGVIDCVYEQSLRVEGGEGPFRWTFTDVFPPGLDLKPVATADDRVVKVRMPRFPGLKVAFTANVFRRDLPEASAPVLTHRSYLVSGLLPRPEVVEVEFPDHPNGARPGDAVPIEVVVRDCRGVDELDGGTVTGASILGAAPLRPLPSTPGSTLRVMTGVLPIVPVRQDKPTRASAEAIKIRITSGGRTADDDETLDIINAAPSFVEGGLPVYVVEPGGLLPLSIDGVDTNWGIDPRPEINGAGIRVVAQPADLATAPLLTDVKWQFASVDRNSGRFLFGADREVRMAATHPDNDGVGPGEDDDMPIDIPLAAIDDNGARQDGVARVVVRNRAPQVDALTFEPAVLSPKVAGLARPFTVRAIVDDQNGPADIGEVVIDVRGLGFPEADAVVMANPSGDRRTYVWQTPDVPADCERVECDVRVTAYDADDLETNGGSGEATGIVRQANVPPVVRADGLVFAPQPDPLGIGPQICTGQTVRFGVRATDPDGSPLTATLVFAGVDHPMTNARPGATDGTFLIDLPMPRRQGTYRYAFRVEERAGAGPAHTVTTPEMVVSVNTCTRPDLSRGPCYPSRGELETCNGLDDDCDGAVDEDNVCDPQVAVVDEPVEPEACGEMRVELRSERVRVAAAADGRVVVADGEAVRLVDAEACSEDALRIEGPLDGLAFDGETVAFVRAGVVYSGPLGDEYRPLAEGVDAEAGFGLAGGRLLIVQGSRRGPIAQVLDVRSGAAVATHWLGETGRAALGDDVLMVTLDGRVEAMALPGGEPEWLEGALAIEHEITDVRIADGVFEWHAEGPEGSVMGIAGPGVEPAVFQMGDGAVDARADMASLLWSESDEDGERALLRDRSTGEVELLDRGPGRIDDLTLFAGRALWTRAGVLTIRPLGDR